MRSFYFFFVVLPQPFGRGFEKNCEKVLSWDGYCTRRRNKNLKNNEKGPEVNLFGSLEKLITALHQNFTAVSLNGVLLRIRRAIIIVLNGGSKGALVPKGASA